MPLMLGLAALATQAATAQPEEYTNLGSRVTAQTLELPILLESGDDIKWFLVELPTVEAEAGFVEIFTPAPEDCFWNGCPGFMLFPHAAVFDAAGGLRSASVNGGDFPTVKMSWGLQDPRPPRCFVYDEFGNIACDHPDAGQWGLMERGWYWIAIGNEFLAGPDNWTVLTNRPPSDPARHTTLTIRVSPPDVPFCDGDFDWDGNVDQEDVWALGHILAGHGNPTGRWADYNRDGNEDQDDLLALVHTIAGGGCPE
ncbi:MAG: hypothetical protein DYG92_12780 [Leptolyngbya sp. PLA1]|nr:hypothetical protein [Leptolyngbya sp. PLA1]